MTEQRPTACREQKIVECNVLKWLVVIVGALPLAGCGSGAGTGVDAGTSADASGTDARSGSFDGGVEASPIAASQLCDELTTLLCEAEELCCTDAAIRHASFEDCFAAEKQACISDLQVLASDPQTGYDPEVARAEINEISRRVAACDIDIGPWFISHQGLLGVFQGTVAEGGDCSPASADDRGPVLSCLSPSVCQLTALPLSGTCGDVRQSGDPCATEIECQEGLRCDPPESLFGTCKARLPDGSSCQGDGDCESLFCEASTCAARSANRVYCFKT